MRSFYSGYQDITSSTPVTNIDRHIIYRDVHVFVNRLNIVAKTNQEVLHLVPARPRGSALLWHDSELLESGLEELSSLDAWYTSLTRLFGIRKSDALRQSDKRRFGLEEMKYQVHRRWTRETLSLPIAAEIVAPHL